MLLLRLFFSLMTAVRSLMAPLTSFMPFERLSMLLFILEIRKRRLDISIVASDGRSADETPKEAIISLGLLPSLIIVQLAFKALQCPRNSLSNLDLEYHKPRKTAKLFLMLFYYFVRNYSFFILEDVLRDMLGYSNILLRLSSYTPLFLNS